MTEYISQEKVVERLHEVCNEAGGISNLADQINVSHESVRIILTGRRPPTGKVLKATGYRRMIVYVKDD